MGFCLLLLLLLLFVVICKSALLACVRFSPFHSLSSCFVTTLCTGSPAVCPPSPPLCPFHLFPCCTHPFSRWPHVGRGALH